MRNELQLQTEVNGVSVRCKAQCITWWVKGCIHSETTDSAECIT